MGKPSRKQYEPTYETKNVNIKNQEKMNIVILRGNVGEQPKITNFENGGKVAQFSMATTERGFKTRDGRDVPDKTTWHNIVVKKTGLAGICEQYVKKGAPLLIVGKVQTRDYTDNSGQKRYVTEIYVEEMELLGGRQDSQNQGQNQGGYGGYQAPIQQYAAPAPAPVVSNPNSLDPQEGDLPF